MMTHTHIASELNVCNQILFQMRDQNLCHLYSTPHVLPTLALVQLLSCLKSFPVMMS